MNRVLPGKTIERLSQYRRVLINVLAEGKINIFSHELAGMLHNTAVQVRRDIMLIGHTGTLRNGYDINELIKNISDIIDTESGQKVAVIGLGNLGRAFIGYLKGKRSKINIVAAFDVNYEKIDKVYSGVNCYHLDKLNEIVKSEKITIGIIAVPNESAEDINEKLIMAGVKGILNYTAKPLHVPHNVFLEEYDMITSLEKVAFFVKKKSNL